MLSVVIPSRSERFLQQTVDDLLLKATGEIEIIVVLDGAWQQLRDDPRVIIIHQGTLQSSNGMRECINAGMRVARGEYVMKADGHTMWNQGFDTKLIADYEEGQVVVPRRYRLDVEKWEVIKDGRPPVDYMFIAYPYERPFDKTCGLHGDIWKEKQRKRLNVPIDDLMTFQGSAYFMSKKHWEWLGGLSTKQYGPFTHESQEISNKTWLGGGRVVVNKKTWYAHLHKGKKYGTGYGYSNEQWRNWAEEHERGRLFCIDYWIYDKWPERKHDWQWLLDKFGPNIPTWPENWWERIEVDKLSDFSQLGKKRWEPHTPPKTIS